MPYAAKVIASRRVDIEVENNAKPAQSMLRNLFLPWWFCVAVSFMVLWAHIVPIMPTGMLM